MKSNEDEGGVAQSGAVADGVPSITLRADNPLHFRVLAHGLDELIKAQGEQAPAVLELRATLRDWELFWRERGGFKMATAFCTGAHFK